MNNAAAHNARAPFTAAPQAVITRPTARRPQYRTVVTVGATRVASMSADTMADAESIARAWRARIVDVR